MRDEKNDDYPAWLAIPIILALLACLALFARFACVTAQEAEAHIRNGIVSGPLN